MSKVSFRAWLRSILPEPVALVLDNGERVVIGKGAKRLAMAEDTIRAKDPDSVDAVDKDGGVLRTYTFREREKEPELPELLEVPEPKTEDQRTLQHFASLISHAYRQGAQDHAAAYRENSGQLVELVNSALGRVAGLEKLLNQMLKDVREDAIEAREQLELAREANADANGSPSPLGNGGAKGFIKELVEQRIKAAVVGGGAAPNGSANGNGASS